MRVLNTDLLDTLVSLGGTLWVREYPPVLARVLFLIPVRFWGFPFGKDNIPPHHNAGIIFNTREVWGCSLGEENIHPHSGGCLFSFELSLRRLGLGLRFFDFRFFFFPIKRKRRNFSIPLPRVISEVLFWGIMTPTFIKKVILTYIIIDILIIIMSINIITSK